MLAQEQLNKVEEYIQKSRDEIVKTVCDLVRINSVQGIPEADAPYGVGVRKALECALEKCRALGLVTENHEYYCGSGILPGSEEKEIGLIAHLDVVPEGSGWSVPPFSATERDGYLVGRGTRDNKGAFAAALYAMAALKEIGYPMKHTVRLIMGCNEETGMQDVDYYLSGHKAPDLTLVTDCGFPVCYGEKGSLSMDIIFPKWENLLELQGGIAHNIVPDSARAVLPLGLLDLTAANHAEDITVTEENGQVIISAKGVSKHAAFPEGSVNAIQRLIAFLRSAGILTQQDEKTAGFLQSVLEDYSGAPLGISCSDQETGVLTCIGGLLFEQDQQMRLNFDIRYPVTASGEKLAAEIQRHCAENGCGFELLKDSAGTYMPPDSPVVLALTDIYHRFTGSTAAPYTMGGGTYARKLPNAIGFGPGDPAEKLPYPKGKGDAHQADESQNISSILNAAKIYASALAELDDRI